MNGKTLIFIITIIMLIPLLSFNVLAADDITNSDMVDAQGGFFRDIAGYISDGFNKSIDGVKNGILYIADGVGKIILAVGNGISKIINSIGNAVKDLINSIVNAVKDIGKFIATAISSLLDGLKRLFIPSNNYFPEIQKRLQTAINSKLGGILSFTEYLKSRFSNLSATSNADDLLVLEYPQGHFFGGTRIDLLYRVRPYIRLFRDLFTGIMMLLTGFYAYRQVKCMVNT